MFRRPRRRSAPLAPDPPAASRPSLAEAEQHDTCARCGRPTPVGVSLCEHDNPAGIGAPSATQAHGTILVAVIVGFAAFLLLGRVALGGVGPFPAEITARAAQSSGGVELAVRVTNEGQRATRATCRVTRGGIAGPDDVTFQTEPIPVGATVDFVRQLRPPSAGLEPYPIDRLAIRCT